MGKLRGILRILTTLKVEILLITRTINTCAKVVSTMLYIQAFKELIDEVIRENRNDPQRAKELMINEMLRDKESIQTTTLTRNKDA